MLYIYIYITRVTWSYFFQFCTKSFVRITKMLPTAIKAKISLHKFSSCCPFEWKVKYNAAYSLFRKACFANC